MSSHNARHESISNLVLNDSSFDLGRRDEELILIDGPLVSDSRTRSAETHSHLDVDKVIAELDRFDVGVLNLRDETSVSIPILTRAD